MLTPKAKELIAYHCDEYLNQIDYRKKYIDAFRAAQQQSDDLAKQINIAAITARTSPTAMRLFLENNQIN